MQAAGDATGQPAEKRCEQPDDENDAPEPASESMVVIARRCDDHGHDAVGAGHDDRGEPQQTVQRVEALGVERPGRADQQRATETGDPGADCEGEQREAADVHTRSPRAVGVVPGRPQSPTHRSTGQDVDDADPGEQAHRLEGVEPSVVGNRAAEGDVGDVRLLEDESARDRPDRKRGERQRQTGATQSRDSR